MTFASAYMRLVRLTLNPSFTAGVATLKRCAAELCFLLKTLTFLDENGKFIAHHLVYVYT
jgi:hypothetical protein